MGRRRAIVAWAAVALVVGAASGLRSRAQAPAALSDVVPLTVADVQKAVQSAAEAISDPNMVIAVTDRAGRMLAVWRRTGTAADAVANEALGLARTGAFFASDQAPLSSRTVRFISGIHFPPTIRDTANAALYGIENTNRGCTLSNNYNMGQAFPPSTAVDGSIPGPGIVTGKTAFDQTLEEQRMVNPGGVPIFKEGLDKKVHVVGGVGVSGVAPASAEYAAFAGSVLGAGQVQQHGQTCYRLGDATRPFGPRPASPGVIFIDGIALPFVTFDKSTGLVCPPAGAAPGTFTGSFIAGPTAGGIAPEGYLVGPNGSAELTMEEVDRIIMNAKATADRTRAAIRLPLDRKTKMVIAVTDLQGNVLGLFRMEDSTIFSVDVAVTKARNVVYFSGPNRKPEDLPGVPMGTAVTNRTISFGAQPLYPPGIHNTSPGPFFGLFQFDKTNPCTQGQDTGPNRSGIVFFPGSAPLYKNGMLVGGLGVSGDGVEQDDYVTAGGAAGFEPPQNIRADHVYIPSFSADGQRINRVRLPYLKFPRRPEQ